MNIETTEKTTKAILGNSDISFTLNNTPFSDKVLKCYYAKLKLPRKTKKAVTSFFLGKGKYKRKGLLLFDEAFKGLDYDGLRNLYKTVGDIKGKIILDSPGTGKI